MAGEQELLRHAWLSARKGNLNALSECKAWALREVWQKQKDSEHGLLVFASERLMKKCGGRPTPGAVGKLFKRMDADSEWFPGKKSRGTSGPTPALSASATREKKQVPLWELHDSCETHVCFQTVLRLAPV